MFTIQRHNILLLSFPLLAVFGLPVKLGSFYLTPTEILIFGYGALYCMAVAMRRIPAPSRSQLGYLLAFLAIFSNNIIGLMVGSDADRWQLSNIRVALRPVTLFIAVLVISQWAKRSTMPKRYAIYAVSLPIALAGLFGLYGMYNQGFSSLLLSLYSPHLIDADLNSRFNMSVRAMSVFTGYDQASITYAFNIAILTSLLAFFRNSAKAKACAVVGVILMVVSIVSSARTGFVTVVAFIPLFFIYIKRFRFVKGVQVLTAAGLTTVALFFTLNRIFPDSSTIERFLDLANFSALMSGGSLIEKSEGINSLYYTQIANLTYPTGADILFGFGDNGKPISDSGYITTFINNGLFGITLLFVALVSWMASSYATLIESEKAGNEPSFTIFNFLLLVFTVISMISAIKGPLYFLSYINGDILVYVLALATYEASLLRSPNRYA